MGIASLEGGRGEGLALCPFDDESSGKLRLFKPPFPAAGVCVCVSGAEQQV